MRKYATNNFEPYIVGPASDRDKAIRTLTSLGIVVQTAKPPWVAVFTEPTSTQLPGKALAEARLKASLTQKRLAELSGISKTLISAMETNRRVIDIERAKKLANVLKVDYRILL